jgi:hypothetical protein
VAPGSLGSPAGLDRNQGTDTDPAESPVLGSFKPVSDVKLVVLVWESTGVG